MSTRLKRVALALASAVISMGVIELALRVPFVQKRVGYPRVDDPTLIHQYARNPDLVYGMKPSFTAYDWGIPITTNSWGLRDREYPRTKPPDVRRIAVIGDSIAFGLGVRAEDTFSELLEVELNRVEPARYEVINFSDIGYTSSQEEIVLTEKVIGIKPDVVVLAFCTNDDAYPDGLDDLARETHPGAIGSRLHSRVLSYVRHRWETRNFASLSSFGQVEHLFEQLSVRGQREGFQAVVVVFPLYFDDLQTYPLKDKHAAVRNVASRYSLPVIDLMDAWAALGASQRRAFFQSDKLHLTPLGMQETTKELIKLRTLTVR
jgi:lysophospholipase L1-like esterase